MAPVLSSVAAVALAAAASAMLTWAWIGIARARGIQDEPGARRLHQSTTPRGGGVAIAIVLTVGFAWSGLAFGPGLPLAGLAIGVALFALTGMADDLLPVPTWIKFALQLLSAIGLVLGISLAWPLGLQAKLLLVVACAYVVNLWNFMDGSNGLVTMQALLISLALVFWPGQPEHLRIAALVLAGASLGFLPFNLPLARVFLGDVGSHALGAAVFGLLLLDWQAGVLHWAQVLLIGTALLLDSGLTLASRALAGRRVWEAHREHLYQYAVLAGHSHLRVCIFYGAVTIAAVALARLLEGSRSSFVMAGWLIFSWILCTGVYLALKSAWLENLHRGREHG